MRALTFRLISLHFQSQRVKFLFSKAYLWDKSPYVRRKKSSPRCKLNLTTPPFLFYLGSVCLIRHGGIGRRAGGSGENESAADASGVMDLFFVCHSRGDKCLLCPHMVSRVPDE